MASEINVDKITPQTGTNLELGDSGDTITVPAGATITNSGTANGFGVSLTNDGNNRVVTATGSGGLNGEANMSFDGSTLDLSANNTELRLPRGTTAQQPTPSAANEGAIRYDTDDNLLYYSNGASWIKVNNTTPSLASASGSILVGLSTSLSLVGTNFLTSGLVVNFLQTSDSINANVTVTPTTDTAATVTVPSSVYSNITAGNVVTIKVTNSDGQSSGTLTITASNPPSGGTITTSGNFRIHTYTSSGTFTNTISNLSLEYMVIAGGGGGGVDRYSESRGAGGGGAGGYRANVSGENSGGGNAAESALILSSLGNSTITIGAGGAGGSGSDNSVGGVNGSESSLTGTGYTAISSTGGGGGGGHQTSLRTGAQSGGSGGGGTNGYGPGSGTSGQGFNGGSGANNSDYGGGGGGGSAEIGENGTTTSGTNKAGDGGDGVSSSINGSATARAAGGGGRGAGGNGSGGSGGGGDGSDSGGTAGTVNTGSGGGASRNTTGGAGGSGIVILRYNLTSLQG
jgi:hypothetical protein